MSAHRTPVIFFAFFLITTAVKAQDVQVTTELSQVTAEGPYKDNTILRIHHFDAPDTLINIAGTAAVTGIAGEPSGFQLVYGWYDGILFWDDRMIRSRGRDLFFILLNAEGNLIALRTWSGSGDDVPLDMETAPYYFELRALLPTLDPEGEPPRTLYIETGGGQGKTGGQDPVEIDIVDQTGETSTEDPEG
ncbi:MAG: hypothetical protein QNK37_03195 [Acidobacteriota bacterium]|nr:hypothetical protein [Acidobacteriota bacterium]